MTKRDYEALAAIIKREMDAARGDREHGAMDSEAIKRLAIRFADVFAFDNPRFDRVRFMKACGFDS